MIKFVEDAFAISFVDLVTYPLEVIFINGNILNITVTLLPLLDGFRGSYKGLNWTDFWIHAQGFAGFSCRCWCELTPEE